MQQKTHSMHTKLCYHAKDITKIFERFALQNPTPQTELYYVNDFTLLVAIVLSARTTDIAVNKATKKLFTVSDSPDSMIKLSEEKIGEYIQSVGLWKTKAKHIVQLSKIIIHDFHGQIPSNKEDLEKLPGVGGKTANVFLNTIYGLPLIAVDTHVFRVARRLGFAKGTTPKAVENELSQIIPSKFIRHAHLWLILHGRYVCKALHPQCQVCIIKDLCKAKENIFCSSSTS